ncbi:trimeric intracellular cation channel family protein [Panacibacter ginsenosidivorans]|uniref:Trimeric intracellular cation channel family protein n=1 Tax=Panacibacter ginsenosidivorans TaxID=1813871 RepID=A0A5B8VAB9_9BACT|nr:trimeric intracellular cation channel family protein [Panacibacter ginsenosidivorans]QEC68417.1 trimeric intracellular cation channel family protein [Panacibacter ginsenosidivorans]
MNFLDLLAYAGIFIFAITGAFKARTYKMDIFGAAVLAFVTAYGGGTLRDLLIGARPVSWVNDNIALLLVLASIVITFLFQLNYRQFRRTIFFTDAVGIGLFTVTGIEKSLAFGLNDTYAVVMGVITATFGGLIADILCNAVPNLLKRGELYATACAIGGVIYILLKKIPLEHHINLSICIIIIVAVRIYSKRKRLSLPEI